jgi:hypothetical protein
LAGSQEFGNSGEPPTVRPKVDRPEEPMDWTNDTLTTSSISLILYLCKFLVHIYNPNVHVITGGFNIITNPSLGASINWTHKREKKDVYTGTYKVRNEIETKRNEINEIETKRNEINENETKRNEINEMETK